MTDKAPDPPKLLLHKPKKNANPVTPSAAPGVAASKVEVPTQGAAGSASFPELKPPGVSRFWHRVRSAFGVLLVANFVIGGYVLLTRSSHSKDDKPENSEEAASVSGKPDLVTSSSSTNSSEQDIKEEKGSSDVVAIISSQTTTLPVADSSQLSKASSDVVTIETSPTAPVPVAASSHLKASQPALSEDQQREILKWILEEKRKTKPTNSAEKKKIDEEKSLLKELLRAKSLPTI